MPNLDRNYLKADYKESIAQEISSIHAEEKKLMNNLIASLAIKDTTSEDGIYNAISEKLATLERDALEKFMGNIKSEIKLIRENITSIIIISADTAKVLPSIKLLNTIQQQLEIANQNYLINYLSNNIEKFNALKLYDEHGNIISTNVAKIYPICDDIITVFKELPESVKKYFVLTHPDFNIGKFQSAYSDCFKAVVEIDFISKRLIETPLYWLNFKKISDAPVEKLLSRKILDKEEVAAIIKYDLENILKNPAVLDAYINLNEHENYIAMMNVVLFLEKSFSTKILPTLFSAHHKYSMTDKRITSDALVKILTDAKDQHEHDLDEHECARKFKSGLKYSF